MSIKLDFKPTELASKSALKKQFKKIRSYYDKFFLNLNDEDDEIIDEPTENAKENTEKDGKSSKENQES